MVDPRGRERGRDRGTGRQGLLNEAREEGCERRLPTHVLNVCLLLVPFARAFYQIFECIHENGNSFLFNDVYNCYSRPGGWL